MKALQVSLLYELKSIIFFNSIFSLDAEYDSFASEC